MNRDELLTKLAMDRVEWPIDIGQCKDFLGWEWSNEDYYPILISADGKRQITRDHWLDRRTELINEPDDADAPEWARWKAQGANGTWYWCESKPTMSELGIVTAGRVKTSKGCSPAGHDWRKTLKPVNQDMSQNEPAMSRNEPHGITGVKHRVGREPNQIDSSPADYQAAQAAMATGVCSDGQPCGQDDYCADCPNAPHAQDARRLDEQLARDMKQPRYQDAKGEDWMDEFARTATAEEFHGAMRFTIGKYNRRMGKKDDMLKEVRKMKDYCARWEQYILAKHR